MNLSNTRRRFTPTLRVHCLHNQVYLALLRVFKCGNKQNKAKAEQSEGKHAGGRLLNQAPITPDGDGLHKQEEAAGLTCLCRCLLITSKNSGKQSGVLARAWRHSE